MSKTNELQKIYDEIKRRAAENKEMNHKFHMWVAEKCLETTKRFNSETVATFAESSGIEVVKLRHWIRLYHSWTKLTSTQKRNVDVGALRLTTKKTGSHDQKNKVRDTYNHMKATKAAEFRKARNTRLYGKPIDVVNAFGLLTESLKEMKLTPKQAASITESFKELSNQINAINYKMKANLKIAGIKA